LISNKSLFLSNSITDDFRYVNFSRSNVDIGAEFNIRDGIFKVPVTGMFLIIIFLVKCIMKFFFLKMVVGVYLFTVHAMPLSNRPFRVQIHHNGISVGIISNGETKSLTI